jgi:hypothetical protein
MVSNYRTVTINPASTSSLHSKDLKINRQRVIRMEYGNKAFLTRENLIASALALACFTVPFFFSNPQLLVGSIVNFTLAYAAFELPWKKIMPIIFLPSIAALLSGLIFGPMSSFLMYMVPFIWAGNILLVYFIKRFRSSVRSVVIPSVYKAGLIFSAAVLLHATGLVPAVFLIAMGPVQLITALAGTNAALLVQRIK